MRDMSVQRSICVTYRPARGRLREAEHYLLACSWLGVLFDGCCPLSSASFVRSSTRCLPSSGSWSISCWVWSGCCRRAASTFPSCLFLICVMRDLSLRTHSARPPAPLHAGECQNFKLGASGNRFPNFFPTFCPCD